MISISDLIYPSPLLLVLCVLPGASLNQGWWLWQYICYTNQARQVNDKVCHYVIPRCYSLRMQFLIILPSPLPFLLILLTEALGGGECDNWELEKRECREGSVGDLYRGYLFDTQM